MRVRGDNSDGFLNEINIEKSLNFKRYEEVNPNLQNFLLDVFKGYSLKGKKIHAIRCRINVKPDFYLHIDGIPKEVYVSVKKGSGNSVHQESLDSFLKFIQSIGGIEQNLNDITLFHYADGTNNNTGKVRLKAKEFARRNPSLMKRVNNFFANKEIQRKCFKRFVFQGKDNHSPSAEYIYHGTAYSGVWASKKEIYDYISQQNFLIDINSICIGPLTYQVWNRNMNFSTTSEYKRKQIQIKWATLSEVLTAITSQRKASKQRGYEEGTIDEITSVITFNRNPDSPIFSKYLSHIKTDINKTLMVRVTTKQYSEISKQKVMTRADAYAISVVDNRLFDILEENEFYLDETILINYQELFVKIPYFGVSIKMSQSTSYQLLKLTPKSFCELFDSYELGAAASLYCQNKDEIVDNVSVIRGWKTDVDKMKNYFSIFNINSTLLVSSIDLCKQLKQYATEQIRNKIDNSFDLQKKIFNGIGVYQEPYTAYFFMQNNVITLLRYIPYSLTTGSGRSHGDFTIVLKPVQRKQVKYNVLDDDVLY